MSDGPRLNITDEQRPGGRGDVSRRELLKRAGILGVVLSLPLGLSARAARGARVLMPMKMKVPTPPASAVGALTGPQLATLAAMAARIVPTDGNGPGATEAGAANYINLSLNGYPNVRDSLAATFVGTSVSSFLPAYQAGLAATDAFAQSSQGAPFAQLAPAQQDAVLLAMQNGVATGFTVTTAAAFFTDVRTHTLQGMLCDPYYGGNVDFIGWKWIGYPGLRMPVKPGDQAIPGPPPLNPISAYEMGIFGTAPPTLKG